MSAELTKLTPAAKRDLKALQAGEVVDLRYGPFIQLLEAGYIEGTQDDYRLVDREES